MDRNRLLLCLAAVILISGCVVQRPQIGLVDIDKNCANYENFVGGRYGYNMENPNISVRLDLPGYLTCDEFFLELDGQYIYTELYKEGKAVEPKNISAGSYLFSINRTLNGYRKYRLSVCCAHMLVQESRTECAGALILPCGEQEIERTIKE